MESGVFQRPNLELTGAERRNVCYGTQRIFAQALRTGKGIHGAPGGRGRGGPQGGCPVEGSAPGRNAGFGRAHSGQPDEARFPSRRERLYAGRNGNAGKEPRLSGGFRSSVQSGHAALLLVRSGTPTRRASVYQGQRESLSSAHARSLSGVLPGKEHHAQAPLPELRPVDAHLGRSQQRGRGQTPAGKAFLRDRRPLCRADPLHGGH